MASPIRIAEQEPAEQKKGDEQKGVKMKKRHRAVEEPLRPERQAPIQLPLEQGCSPMMQKKQPCRNRIKQPALSDKHRQWNRFPCEVLLVIFQGKGLEEKEPSQTSVKEKCGHTK